MTDPGAFCGSTLFGVGDGIRIPSSTPFFKNNSILIISIMRVKSHMPRTSR